MFKKIFLFFIFIIFNSVFSQDYITMALNTICNVVPRTEDKRSSSYPFISADSYRSICDHTCDEVLSSIVKPANVRSGDLIFVNPIFLEHFFYNIHPDIKNPYILVTVGHDVPTPGNFLEMLDSDLLIHWFGANGDILSHLKFTHIPIGISNNYWPHGNTSILSSVINSKNKIKKFLSILNFTINTNRREREPVYEFFAKKKFTKVAKIEDFKNYLINMSFSKFVFSPHGNGLDCHRTWEAILVGSYPIVKRSTLDCLYQKLPVVIVDNWDEVTEEFLNFKFNEFSQLSTKNYFELHRLYFKYYQNLIISKKNSFIKVSRSK